MLAQRCANVVTPVSRRYREDDDIAVAAGRGDLPGDMADDRIVTGLGNLPAGVR